jgi:hypothetical protein
MTTLDRQGHSSGRRNIGRLDRRRLRAAVLKAACDALADGRARLVSVQPPALLAEQGLTSGEDKRGVRIASNICPSEDSMDIFIEPMLPQPQVVVCGSSPVAVAVAEFAKRMGFAVTACAPTTEQAAFCRGRPADRRPCTAGCRTGPGLHPRIAQGRGDERHCARRSPPRPTMSPSWEAAASQRRGRPLWRRAAWRPGGRPPEGAGRPRHRRHPAGRNRAFDPRRDHRGATGRSPRGAA